MARPDLLPLGVRIFRWTSAILAACAAWIAVDGLHDDVEKCDVGVVFGSMVMPNGSPSARLAARLDKAAELYSNGVFGHVIVSGGRGKEGWDESATMKAYLRAHGVPQSAIIQDQHGDTTWDTARNTAAIMSSQGYSSALVVTQYFHISRARLALRKQGLSMVHTAHARFFEWRDFYSLLREMPAMVQYWFR